MENITVGSEVVWLGSNYTVIELQKNGAILKQNFSVGTVLINPIPVKELLLKQN